MTGCQKAFRRDEHGVVNAMCVYLIADGKHVLHEALVEVHRMSVADPTWCRDRNECMSVPCRVDISSAWDR